MPHHGPSALGRSNSAMRLRDVVSAYPMPAELLELITGRAVLLVDDFANGMDAMRIAARPDPVIRVHPEPIRGMMARVSSRAVAQGEDGPSVRGELYGWAATLIFVAFSYALRRILNQSPRR